MQTAIVFPDTHIPLQDKRAWKCALKAIEVVRPDIFVHLGDVGEWGSVSHWQYKRKTRPPLEYILPSVDIDFRLVNRYLDFLDDALKRAGCKRTIITQGNHDTWCDYFVEEHPYLQQYGFANGIMAEERGYEIFTHNEKLFLGDLYLYHGDKWAGMYHGMNHLRRLGCSVMYGHHHDRQQASHSNVHGTINSYSIGCLKLLDNERNDWLKGRDHNWSHSIAVLYIDNGKTTVQVIPINDGTIFLNGRKYVCCDDGKVRWAR